MNKKFLSYFFGYKLLVLTACAAIFSCMDCPCQAKVHQLRANTDTYISHKDPDTNYGSLKHAELSGNADQNLESNFMVGFKIDDIKKFVQHHQDIKNIKIYLDVRDPNESQQMKLLFYRIESPWKENEVTWNSAPAYSNEHYCSTELFEIEYSKVISCDVTKMIMEDVVALNKPFSGFYVMITGTEPWKRVSVYTGVREYSYHAPVLQIAYGAPPHDKDPYENADYRKKTDISWLLGLDHVLARGSASDYKAGLNDFPETPSYDTTANVLIVNREIVKKIFLGFDLRLFLDTTITKQNTLTNDRISVPTYSHLCITANFTYKLERHYRGTYFTIGAGVDNLINAHDEIIASEKRHNYTMIAPGKKTNLALSFGGGLYYFFTSDLFGAVIDYRYIYINSSPNKIQSINLIGGFVMRWN